MSVRVRVAALADAETLLAWRNDPHARAMSVQTDAVTLEQHLAWFAASLRDPNRLLLVAEKDKRAVGMCRFDIDAEAPDVCEVSINLAPERRGEGLGRPLLSSAIAHLTKAHPEVRTIRATIRRDNASSVRLFESSGFARVESETPADSDFVLFSRTSVV